MDQLPQNEFAEFETRDACNEGVRVQLEDKTGRPTEHWLLVLGPDSDAYRRASVRVQRESFALGATLDPEERDQRAIEMGREMVASLIVDWSFKTPCTRANVVQFLTKAPYVEELVNDRVTSRVGFFALRSLSSATSPLTNSSWTSQSETPDKLGAKASEPQPSTDASEDSRHPQP